jgi:hypothetical protein
VVVATQMGSPRKELSAIPRQAPGQDTGIGT